DLVNNGTFVGGSGDNVLEFTGDVSGAGSFTGNVAFSGSYSPGSSPALVTHGDTTFAASNVLTMELGGLVRGSEYDAIDANSLVLGGTLSIRLLDLGGGQFVPTPGATFDLLSATLISGTFGSYDFAALGPTLTWSIAYLTDAVGTTDVVRLSVTAVPEPETWILMLAGLGLVGALTRRKMQR
ncbi:MAG: PEP-CTERM sorting domain-containing protein, partial [Burkholderiales bacterium]|nr:PEP-CTERM sorting domain-containing protein [Burkholderiales bacterium]